MLERNATEEVNERRKNQQVKKMVRENKRRVDEEFGIPKQRAKTIVRLR